MKTDALLSPALAALLASLPTLAWAVAAPPAPKPAPSMARTSETAPQLLQPPPPNPGYASTLDALNEQARAFERDPANRYTYCLRTSATYECVSYGRDGQLRKQRTVAEAHGTGVAYQQLAGETYLLTNAHVADWPEITDAAHPVDGVASGCKRVGTSLKIVDDENDDYAADDIPLTRVVSDTALDAAVVKSRVPLRIMPYRIGRSSLLKAGDAVVVQGFPLGAFRAITTGQVINTHDHDEYGDWNHDDFVIDAPLSAGNSGSPVFAVSQRTGEYELVGLFHAEYTAGHALNAAIAIEQLRDLMFTLKRSTPAPGLDARSGPEQRAAVLGELAHTAFVPQFRFDARTVVVHAIPDALVYEIFGAGFPLDDRRDLLIVDQPAPGAFGVATQLWYADDSGFSQAQPRSLDSESQAAVVELLSRLHALTLETAEYRRLQLHAGASRQAQADFEHFKKSIGKESSSDSDLADALDSLLERLRARPDATSMPYEQVWAALTTPAPAAAPGLQPPGPGSQSVPVANIGASRPARPHAGM